MIAKKTAMLDVVSKLQLLEVKNKKISCAAARSRKAMINPLLGNRSGFFFHSKPNLNSSAHSCQMDVSKNNDTPKWITLLKWMIWGFYPPIFGSTPKSKNQDAKVRMLTSSCFEVEKTTKVSAASTFLPRKICTPRESSRKPTKMSPKKKKKKPERFKNGRFSDYILTNQAFFTRKKNFWQAPAPSFPETRDILYISVEKRTVQSSRFQGFFVQIALFGFLFGQVSLGPYLGSFA